MGKLIPLLPILGMLLVPSLTARDPNPRRGLRRALVLMVFFNFFVLFALRVILPRVQ